VKPDRLLFFAAKQYSGPSQMDRSEPLNPGRGRALHVVENAASASGITPQFCQSLPAATLQLRERDGKAAA
jgi:hypothetical protein